MMERKDPIGEKYFRPLSSAEQISGLLFWVSAALSIVTLFVGVEPWSDFLQIAFVIFVMANFVVGYGIRLWLAPRAEEQRRLDLLSNSYSVSLTHENAVGYFNNNESNPIRRLALSVMESSFFTKKIGAEMLLWERVKIAIYFLIWLTCVLMRSVELSWIAAATQAVFSEELIAKWLRMEWLTRKSDAIYTKLHRLITTAHGFNNSACHAQVLESFSEYEATKARASVTLSKSIFEKRNLALSGEWETIKASLGLT